MSSVAEKARMMNGWMMIKVEMNIRFRLWGSCCRCLASYNYEGEKPAGEY